MSYFISGIDNDMNTMLHSDLNLKIFASHSHGILRPPRNIESIQTIMQR